MAKIVKNLTLDTEAVRKGERYSRKRGTSISQLVSDLLAQLPDEGQGRELAPATARLLGAGTGRHDDKGYRQYLEKKYSG